MGKPDYSKRSLNATATIEVLARRHTLNLYLPEKTGRSGLSTKEIKRIKGCFAKAIQAALEEWVGGLDRGGFPGDARAPYEELVDRMMPVGASLDSTRGFIEDTEVWKRYKVWRPLRPRWFKTCFGKSFEDFDKRSQRWIRNRFFCLIFALCSNNHHLMLSTGDSGTLGFTFSTTPTYKNRHRESRDMGDAVVNPGDRIEHLWAFQRVYVYLVLSKRLRESSQERSEEKKLIYLKRSPLSKELDADGFSKAFTHTLIHEYSHAFSYTKDFWYIGSYDGGVYGRPAASRDSAMENLDKLSPKQQAMLIASKKRFIPEMLIANADSYANYLSHWMPSLSPGAALDHEVY